MSDSNSKDYNPNDISLLAPNEDLMNQRQITGEQRRLLQTAYAMMGALLNRPEMYENPVEQITGLEYVMQYLWGFELDSDYHSYWFKIKGCACPKWDNEENFGTGMRIMNERCQWHGGGK